MKHKAIRCFGAAGLILLVSIVAFGCGMMPAVMAMSVRPAEPSESSGETPPEKPADGGDGEEKPEGDKPEGDEAKVNYNGAKVFTDDATEEGKSYSSNTTLQNAILVSGGEVTLKNPSVIKSGASTSEHSDFYGTNAAILVHNGAVLTINGGSVNTKAQHANAIFAYGSGAINVIDTEIATSAANSGALMIAGGGALLAKNVTATTDGNSSAPIRSDRGGGTLTVDGGTFTSNGAGSPAIYSTADITVKDATLTATKSEGVVIEGENSVSLNKVTLTDTNNVLHGNSETYKNIFIYQSMSGDATEGVGTFSAEDSTLITNNGDDFFVTNTTAVINLTNTIITHNSKGALLRAQKGKWGKTGENGGHVTLNASDEEFYGDIVLDNISTLDMSLTDGSYYRGVLNGENTAKSATLDLAKQSVFVLEGDSYIESLTNADTENSNIYSNGYTLYVGGNAVKVNTATLPEGKVGKTGVVPEDDEEAQATAEAKKDDITIWLIAGGIGLGVILFVIIAVIIHKKRHKTPPMTGAAVGPPPTPTTPPNIGYPMNHPPIAQ